MSAHIFDDIPRLLTGEASRETVLTAAAHLRQCADCQQELVSALVAHASLSSARRFAPEVATAPDAAERVLPDSHPAPLPDLSSVFAQVRQEAAATTRVRRRGRLLLGVAAAVVVVGGGIAGGLLATESPSGPVTSTVRLVGPGHVAATATLIGGDRMRIDASSLPALGSGKQYEVWLTNASGTALQAVGFMPSDRRADIAVPAPLMGQYQDIAVSVQGNHQTSFSGKVVLHGTYD